MFESTVIYSLAAPSSDFCLPCSCTIECWKTRLNDEWQLWANYMWEFTNLYSQWVMLAGRQHLHLGCQCGIQGIRLIPAVPKCCNCKRWCLKVTQVRLLLADMQCKEISRSDDCISDVQSLGGLQLLIVQVRHSCYWKKVRELETSAFCRGRKKTFKLNLANKNVQKAVPDLTRNLSRDQSL